MHISYRGKFSAYWSALEKRLLPSYVWTSDPLTFWRERILFLICFIAAVFGPIALVPSLLLSYSEGLWIVILVDSLAYLAAVTILVARNASFIVRALVLCFLLYALGVFILFILGPGGAGYIWLFGASVLISTFIGLGAAIWTLGFNTIVMLSVGIFIAYGNPVWILHVDNALEKWMVMSTNFLLLNAFVTITTAFLLNGLKKAFLLEQKISESLRESEEKYRTILEDMEDVYFEVDIKGNITFVNHSSCKMSGYSEGELIAMSFKKISAPDDIEKVMQYFGEIILTEKANKPLLWNLVKKNGEQGFFEIIVSLIRDKETKPIGFRGIGRDITERRLAEIKLRNYSEEIGELYNNAPCGYHSLGPDGIITRVNDTELKWLGYERDETVGKIKWSDLLTEASRIAYCKCWPVLKERGWLNDMAYDLIRKDGSSFPVLRNVTAIRDKEGNVIGSRAIIFDISERKKTRSALEATNLQLFNAYEELQKRQKMIIQQEKMASIGMLAAGVAHEIKNPLAIISQGGYYLQKTVKDSPLLIEVIERLNKAVSRADMIVKGLLRYSRQTPISLVKQDIVALVDESLVLTEHEFRAKNIQVTKKYQPNLAKIPVDDNQIKQVFVNLIINAIHAMSQKGRLTITARQLEDGGKKFIQLSFEDTGHGIPADKIKNVFDPFYTTKAVGSTGLGLSISKGIIDMHGGTIYAESPEGEGAKFIIQLPLT